MMSVTKNFSNIRQCCRCRLSNKIWTWKFFEPISFIKKVVYHERKYTVILFPETPNFNTVIVALKSKEIEWSVLLDSRLSPRKPVQTGSNRFKILSLVLKFENKRDIFGRIPVFYTWKMWKSSIHVFKIFVFEFLSRIGLYLIFISLVGRSRCLGW